MKEDRVYKLNGDLQALSAKIDTWIEEHGRHSARIIESFNSNAANTYDRLRHIETDVATIKVDIDVIKKTNDAKLKDYAAALAAHCEKLDKDLNKAKAETAESLKKSRRDLVKELKLWVSAGVISGLLALIMASGAPKALYDRATEKEPAAAAPARK